MGAPTEAFGPYRVYEQIGLGGMATVHRAETQGIAGFSKQVALKRMLPSVAADQNLVKSFIREARLASHLRHANVAQTYDLGKVGDTYFIAMELVPGRNLMQILKHCAGVVGHMPLSVAMNIVNQICDALDYAHDLCDESGQPLGIIHRDVSPSNIIVSEGGVVKLIDFGIAKATARGMNTLSGTLKGKFGYMAPEYLMGSIDARADLFALGVIAHELLANRPLFQGRDDMETLYRVKNMPIQPPSSFNKQVPAELDAIILTALARDPDQRWQRATALRTALTAETKRLGLVAHNSQVIEWIEWAFQQTTAPADPDSEPEVSISGGTLELARPSRRPDDWNAADTATVRASDSYEAAARKLDLPTRLIRPSAQLPDDDQEDTRERQRPRLPPEPPRNTPLPAHAARTVMVAAATDVPAPGPAPADARTFIADAAQAPQLAGRATPAPGARTLPGQGATVPAPPILPPSVRTFQGVAAPSEGRTPMPRDGHAPVLDDLDARGERPSAKRLLGVLPNPGQLATAVRTRVSPTTRRRASNFLLALLVLIAAGAAAGVVYFALPYLT